MPFLSSKGTWKHTLRRCLLIAWHWAIVGSIGSSRGCRSWLPTIIRLMIPWVDGLVLPKWWNRWSWLVDIHYESIPDLISPIWLKERKQISQNTLSKERATPGKEGRDEKELSGSDQLNCSTLPQDLKLPAPSQYLVTFLKARILLLWTPCCVTAKKV